MTPVSRETRRDITAVVVTIIGVAAAVTGVWFAAAGLLAALWAWPALIPELIAAAIVAVDVTSPRPRLVKINHKGQ